MTTKPQKFNIPLKQNEDRVIFQIVVDKKLYNMAKQNKDGFNISIIVQSDLDGLIFDVVKCNKNG